MPCCNATSCQSQSTASPAKNVTERRGRLSRKWLSERYFHHFSFIPSLSSHRFHYYFHYFIITIFIVLHDYFHHITFIALLSSHYFHHITFIALLSSHRFHYYFIFHRTTFITLLFSHYFHRITFIALLWSHYFDHITLIALLWSRYFPRITFIALLSSHYFHRITSIALLSSHYFHRITFQLPKCLCIHIQRTVWLSNGMPMKRCDKVRFPELLNMTPYVYHKKDLSKTRPGNLDLEGRQRLVGGRRQAKKWEINA